MKDVLKLLRYNTGNDKKAFVKFKEKFDASIFNATIVAHSRSAIADIVSVHKRHYIIDPQTHIFQHRIEAIQNPSGDIKKSVQNYLCELPAALTKTIIEQRCPLSAQHVSDNLDELTKAVYKFETEYINDTISKKEYDKYLEYAGVGPEPKVLIAPYFMFKKEYSLEQLNHWAEVNKKCLEKFIAINDSKYTIATQLVLDQQVLSNKNFIELIRRYYDVKGCKYIFLWIDAFSPIDATIEMNQAFYELLKCIGELNLKPVMAYGGYDSILLCNPDFSYRLFGVAQSVGYGEAREITPVGGGFPINKYYFYPTHQRLKFGDVARMLANESYFDEKIALKERTERYFAEICNCDTCHRVIKEDINNFQKYNESIAFDVEYKRIGKVKKLRPTTDANIIAAEHFMWSKVTEWSETASKSFSDLKVELLAHVQKYSPEQYAKYKEWCEIYV